MEAKVEGYSLNEITYTVLPEKEGEKGLTDYMIQHVCARSWVCCDNDFGRPEETLHSCQIIVYTESSAYESVEIIGKKHAAVLNGSALCSAAGSVAQRRVKQCR